MGEVAERSEVGGGRVAGGERAALENRVRCPLCHLAPLADISPTSVGENPDDRLLMDELAESVRFVVGEAHHDGGALLDVVLLQDVTCSVRFREDIATVVGHEE